MNQFKAEYNRRGCYALSISLVRELLRIPSDVVVTGASYNASRDILHLYLKGKNKQLEQVHEACIAPLTAFNVLEPHDELKPEKDAEKTIKPI